MTPSQTHITLDNEYEFKGYCNRQSIQAFEIALNQKSYPSTSRFAVILVTDLIYTPFYLIAKISEVVFHFWNLIILKEIERKPFQVTHISSLAKFLSLQLSIPLVCTAIRISATIAGFIVPCWALQGWKIAESGEEIFYQLWSQRRKESMCNPLEQPAREEIVPSNAIFYLGMEKTYSCLAKPNIQDGELEKNISELLSHLLQEIALIDSQCFRKLFYYDSAIAPSEQLSKKNPFYLSHDIKEILYSLKQCSLIDDKFKQEELDKCLIDQVISCLSTEQMQRIHLHVCLNLKAALLEHSLKLDELGISKYLTLLNDLFSQRFRFGRAHFPQLAHSLIPYLKI
jgi:hypothetical protein